VDTSTLLTFVGAVAILSLVPGPDMVRALGVLFLLYLAVNFVPRRRAVRHRGRHHDRRRHRAGGWPAVGPFTCRGVGAAKRSHNVR
jgi:threonine/homoserine/homoserine lactone efflux protein